MIIEPNDYRFTMPEVVGEDSVNQMNLRNWMSRDIMEVGQKHKLGRWLFSISDVIRVRVVSSLTRLGGFPPAEANKIADRVVLRFHFLASRSENGDFEISRCLKIGSLAGRKVLVITAWHGQQSAMLGTYDANGKLEVHLTEDHIIPFEEVAKSPYLMVPMDEIIGASVMSFTTAAMEEAGENVPTDEFTFAKSSQNVFEAIWSLDGMIFWYGRESGRLTGIEAAVDRAPADMRAGLMDIQAFRDKLTRLGERGGNLTGEEEKELRLALRSAIAGLDTLDRKLAGDEQ